MMRSRTVKTWQTALVAAAAALVMLTVWSLHERYRHATAYYHDAFQCDHRGDFTGELAALKSAIAQDPYYMKSYYLLGRYYFFHDKDGPRMIEAFSTPFRYPRLNAAVTWQCLGLLYRVSGDRTEALDCFERALKLDPACAEAYFSLGSIYIAMGDSARGVWANVQAIGIDADFSDAHSNLGVAYMKTGRTNDAVAQDRIAVAINSNSASFRYNLGLHLSDFDPKAALEEYKTAVELDPDNVQNRVALAEQHVQMGNLAAAEKEYVNATRTSHRSALAYTKLADFYESTHRAKNAALAYHQALLIEPNNLVARDRLAVIESKASSRDSLIDRRNFSAGVLSWDAEAHNRLGSAYDELNDTRAISELEASVRLNPTSSQYRASLAEALVKNGDALRAEQEFRKAIQLDASNLRAYDKLGLLYESNRRFDEAAQVYREMDAHSAAAPGIQDMAQTKADMNERFASTAHETYLFTNAQGVIVNVNVHSGPERGRPGFDAANESTYTAEDYLGLATTLMGMRENERAAHFYERGLALATGVELRIKGTMGLAEVYRRMNRTPEGLILYENLVREFPDDGSIKVVADKYRASTSSTAATQAAPR